VCGVMAGMLHALIQFADTTAAQAAKLVCNVNYMYTSDTF